MKAKVLEAEERNKISSEQAEQTMKALTASETILKAQVDSLREEIDKLIRSQNQTNRNVQSLLDEYKARDEQIKDLIVQEFGDDLE
jgi:cell division protein FtsB